MRKWPPRRLALAAYAVTALGLTGLVLLVGHELVTWYPAVTPAQQKYIAHRILYALVTNTDLPVVQVILAGIALWLAARRRKRRASLAQPEARPAEGPFKQTAPGAEG